MVVHVMEVGEKGDIETKFYSANTYLSDILCLNMIEMDRLEFEKSWCHPSCT